MLQVNYAEDIVPLSSFRSEVTRLMLQTRYIAEQLCSSEIV